MAYPYDGMFYPTLPQDTQDFGQVLSGVGRSLRDISRGVSYYPYDLLGSGVDVANLALGAVGLGSERPVLGSDYLRNIARSLGMAQEPTGSATENITRLAAGLTNPMAGARAVGRVGEITTEQANRAADALVRQITGNPTATAPQVLQETSMPFMQAVAPKAPKYFTQIPDTSEEIDRITGFLEKRAKDSGFDVKTGASNISGSRYITIEKRLPDDEVEKSVEIRVSNHGDRHPFTSADEKISIDPVTGTTLQDVLGLLDDRGFKLRKTEKKEKKLTDADFAKKYGMTTDEAEVFAEQYRKSKGLR